MDELLCVVPIVRNSANDQYKLIELLSEFINRIRQKESIDPNEDGKDFLVPHDKKPIFMPTRPTLSIGQLSMNLVRRQRREGNSPGKIVCNLIVGHDNASYALNFRVTYTQLEQYNHKGTCVRPHHFIL